ncbi:MAG: hypothetical protein JWO03_34 [Bacteroidetes bacterium]|nr:hypothetical protein [Bacteroidota bacterium]
MFRHILSFELAYRFRRPATWIYFSILLVLVFASMCSENVTFGAGNIHKNAPFTISIMMVIFSAFGMLITSAIFSVAVQRDFELNTYSLFYTAPITRAGYLLGRFIGAFITTVFVFLAIPLGIFIGSVITPAVGWIDPAKIGPNSFWIYFQPFMVFVVPGIFITGSIFFAVATLTRRMIFSYLGNVILLVAYLIAINEIGDFNNLKTVSLVDPFGLIPVMDITRYWTVLEQNSMCIPFVGTLLINRLIWIGIGALLFAVCYYFFSFQVPAGARSKKMKDDTDKLSGADLSHLPQVSLSYSTLSHLRFAFNSAIVNFFNTVRQLPFSGIVSAGVAFLFFAAQNLQSLYGTKIYPVTYSIIGVTSGSFALFVMIIITFFSGELVWTERELKLNQIYDALPVPNWMQFWSKALTLFLINLLLMTVVMVSGILLQLGKGYSSIDFGQYFVALYLIALPGYMLLSIFALFIQVLVSNKYIGHFIMVLYYIIILLAFPLIGLEHGLYRFFRLPGFIYSDMNGYGNYIPRILYYMVYWGAAALVIAVVSQFLWPRGTDESLASRIKVMRSHLTTGYSITLIGTLLVFLCSGAAIYYKSDVQNKYVTSKDREKQQAEYEKKYKKFQNKPQPKVASVFVKMDLRPEQLSYTAQTQITLQNRTTVSIDSIVATYSIDQTVCEIAGMGKVIFDDKDLGFRIYKLDKPLNPGDSVSVTLKSELTLKGFPNGTMNNTIGANGTFVHNSDFVPTFGYNMEYELDQNDKRKKHDLPKKEEAPAPEVNKGREYNLLAQDADWINYECIVSTTPSQIAISPGYLLKEWTDGGRRYFHYKMDAPILNFYSILSGKYEVARDEYKGIKLEIYYHKGHEYNLPSMMDGMKDALKYASDNFSPYQFRQARIIEFPRYETFAQSFANTIPFSEGIGFIADLRDADQIDYPYYVTAHEIAHQWWGHQICGSIQKGSVMMVESMAQYTSLMVMKQKFGPVKVRRFLKYELDQYLSGRQFDKVYENPLYHASYNQQYIFYQKGSNVMFGMQDYIGEANFNKAMSAFIRANQFQQAPYCNSIDFLDTLSHYTPDSLHYLIADMYKSITLYSNKCTGATYVQTPDHKYKVTITIEAEKLKSDSVGKETKVPFADYIDIGVLSKETKGKFTERQLYLSKHLIRPGKSTIEVIVNEEPDKAGIDIYNKLIDRDSDDNLKDVTKAPAK